MSTEIKTAGWIVYTNEAIYGTGKTLRAAKADARKSLDQDTDLDTSLDIDYNVATAALIAQVEIEGGAIVWGEWNGIACTTEEADEA